MCDVYVAGVQGERDMAWNKKLGECRLGPGFEGCSNEES